MVKKITQIDKHVFLHYLNSIVISQFA